MANPTFKGLSERAGVVALAAGSTLAVLLNRDTPIANAQETPTEKCYLYIEGSRSDSNGWPNQGEGIPNRSSRVVRCDESPIFESMSEDIQNQWAMEAKMREDGIRNLPYIGAGVGALFLTIYGAMAVIVIRNRKSKTSQ